MLFVTRGWAACGVTRRALKPSALMASKMMDRSTCVHHDTIAFDTQTYLWQTRQIFIYIFSLKHSKLVYSENNRRHENNTGLIAFVCHLDIIIH